MKALIISVLLFCNTAIIAQVCDTITIHANTDEDNDATLWSLNPNQFIPEDPNMIAEGWTQSGNSFVTRAIMKFPLPNIPAFASITSAKVHYYYNPTTTHLQGNSYYPGSPYSAYTNEGTIYRVNQNWSAFTVNWANQPTYTMQNAVSIPFSSAKTQDLTVNVTDLVKDMYLYPNTSFGFLFKMNNEAIYRSQVYASSNNADITLHPKLVICYNLAPNSIENYSKIGNEISYHNNMIYIHNNLKLNLNEIVLSNINGSIILNYKINSNESEKVIPINKNLPTGIYFIKLNSTTNSMYHKILIN